MALITIATVEEPGQYPVDWKLSGMIHIILYGERISKHSDACEASEAFGHCVRHQQESAGKFDDALLLALTEKDK